MVRIIAVLLLLIPGLVAAIGIKLMRDTLFNEFNAYLSIRGSNLLPDCCCSLADWRLLAVLSFTGTEKWKEKKKAGRKMI